MQPSYLDNIVASTRQRVAQLRVQHDYDMLLQHSTPAPISCYAHMQAYKDRQQRIVIAEYKRQSPSGHIAPHADLADQLAHYSAAGAAAISVLTEPEHFAGSHTDLAFAASNTTLPILQKDFVLDPIQVLLARQAGAHAVLLIAAILQPNEIEALTTLAHSLNMAVLLELHQASDLAKQNLAHYPLIGINHRDLATFRLAIGRSSHLARQLPAASIKIAESGIHSLRDAALATTHTHGILVGTALMHQPTQLASLVQAAPLPQALKACGVRTAADAVAAAAVADFVGINLSAASKRRMPLDVLQFFALPPNAVAVCKGFTEAALQQLLQQFPFAYIQVYADDVSPDTLRHLPARVLLSIDYTRPDLLALAEGYAPHVYSFLLEGPTPGSGVAPTQAVPSAFPYPFLLGGGLHAQNLHLLAQHPLCWGADMATGLEDAQGQFSLAHLQHTRTTLHTLHPQTISC